MISLLLVDDHDLVRLGIKKLFDDVAGMKVIGEAKTGEDAIRLVKELNPQIILLDLRAPGMSTLEVTRKILRINSEARILAISSFEDELSASRILQAGAAGYLTKNTSLDELIRAIRTIKAGQRYITPDIAQKLALKHLDPQNNSPFELLTDRELQIISMLLASQKVTMISAKLCLSAKTVNGYRYRVFKKLGVTTDVGLTLLAIRHGFIESYTKAEV